ncbi:GNAT family N-acetyltransferase [Profundibacterium mesophilum]|nr:GNAT family N-acetyltransferase [Profundibacterium mesophilum]
MSQTAPTRLEHALAQTWPPAATMRAGPWRICAGRGGGKRVSAARALEAGAAGQIALAEREMQALRQPCLFQLGTADEALDAALAALGYQVMDPTVFYHAPIAHLAEMPPEPVSGFWVWEPLQIMRDIWQAGGIGPERIAVMQRVKGPKIGLLGRAADKPAGAAFVALDGDVAMLHAVEILPELRRHGAGRNLLRHAVQWARREGARTLALVVREENAAACALYEGLGMELAGRYHYRIQPQEDR